MNQQKKIKLIFDTNTGKVRVDAIGFHGSECVKATEFLKKTLGKCTDFKRKEEWYTANIEMNGNINSNLCG